jgi:predicted ATPase
LLKFGRAPNSPAQPIDLVPITVFVGPNNSGKSKSPS